MKKMFIMVVLLSFMVCVNGCGRSEALLGTESIDPVGGPILEEQVYGMEPLPEELLDKLFVKELLYTKDDDSDILYFGISHKTLKLSKNEPAVQYIVFYREKGLEDPKLTVGENSLVDCRLMVDREDLYIYKLEVDGVETIDVAAFPDKDQVYHFNFQITPQE